MKPLRIAASEASGVILATTDAHKRLRDRLIVIGVATLGIDLICAIAAFLLERDAHRTEIKTFGSALFWTSTQLLTVSSQLRNPITAGGRVLDVFMEAYAITVIAALAGSIGAFLHKRGLEADESPGPSGGANLQAR
ncbi:MAG TPA: hypothetical protein VFJ64_03260 [Solirubrobacterales bacterium]|nr:hypothetical protein [Solirubrobacterales bacterium]